MFKNDVGAATVKKCFLVSQSRNLSRCLQFQVLRQGLQFIRNLSKQFLVFMLLHIPLFANTKS